MSRSSSLFRQSGVIPYRFRDGRLEVLVITSSNGRRWVVPKGLVEPDLTPAESAAKEAWEEAGVRGRVSVEVVGTYTYDKWGGTCHVEVFLMRVDEVLETWPEMERIREWATVEGAAARMKDAELRALLLQLPELVKKS